MDIVVIYDTKFGNTAQVARAIARGAAAAGSVRVLDTTEAAGSLPQQPGLLILGGPTQRRGPSAALRSFVDDLPAVLRRLPAATFDTRYRGATLLMGSAASDAARRIAKAGSRLATPPESFFVTRGGPLEAQGLEPGELERAEAWGRRVAASATAGQRQR
ncbi:MAG TPA: flavodoxin domain-containing protein [Candidatus Limnocylindrales bacterium]